MSWLASLALLAGALSCSGGSDMATSKEKLPPQLSASQILKACAMAMSCVSPGLVTAGAECAHELERADVAAGSGPLDNFASCTLAAPDCTTALACATLDHGPDYCAAHPGTTCDGNLVVSCTGLTTPAWPVDFPPYDCAAVGMTCANGGCTDGKSCNTDVVSQCIGQNLVGCAQSTMTEASTDCALIYAGGTCGRVDTMPGCVPPGNGFCASGSSSYACKASLLLGCANLLDGQLDCAQFGSQCVDDVSGIADCVPTATDCTRSSPDRCNGAALEICQDGKYQDFDCSTVGLPPCAPTASGGVACGGG